MNLGNPQRTTANAFVATKLATKTRSMTATLPALTGSLNRVLEAFERRPHVRHRAGDR